MANIPALLPLGAFQPPPMVPGCVRFRGSSRGIAWAQLLDSTFPPISAGIAGCPETTSIPLHSVFLSSRAEVLVDRHEFILKVDRPHLIVQRQDSLVMSALNALISREPLHVFP